MTEEGKRQVTLDDMFRVKIKIDVMGRELYIRALSEIAVQARGEYAMLAMAKRRKAISTPGTPEHESYVEGLVNEKTENLVAAILSVEAQDKARDLQDPDTGIIPALIPFPDKATDEEQTDILQQRIDENKRVVDARAKAIDDFLKARRIELETFSHEQIVYLVKGKQIEAQGSAARYRAFTDYTLYASVFVDEMCQTRMFKRVEDVGELPATARDTLVDKYYGELDRITQQDLQYAFSTADSKDTLLPVKDLVSNLGAGPTKRRGGGRKH